MSFSTICSIRKLYCTPWTFGQDVKSSGVGIVSCVPQDIPAIVSGLTAISIVVTWNGTEVGVGVGVLPGVAVGVGVGVDAGVDVGVTPGVGVVAGVVLFLCPRI